MVPAETYYNRALRRIHGLLHDPDLSEEDKVKQIHEGYMHGFR